MWLKEYKRPTVRPATFDGLEMIIRCQLKPALGHIPLKDLRPEYIQRLYNEKSKSGLAPRYIRRIHVTLHSALEQAMKNQLVTRNTSKAVMLPKMGKKEIQPLSLEQVGQLLGALQGDRLYPAILLEFNTGLRRGELLGLRWQDVDLKSGTLQVKKSLARVGTHTEEGPKTRLIFQEPKTSQSRRTIPIPEDALEELKRHKSRQAQEKLLLGQAYQDHGLVFCQADGRPIDPHTFGENFKRNLEAAGLPHIRVHDARHYAE